MRSAAGGGSLAGGPGLAGARFAVETLALSLVLFAAGLLVHEAAHLVVIRALGHDAVLVVRPWTLGVGGWSIYGLHAQPASPLAPGEQLLVNFAGPFLAALPLSLLLTRVADHSARTALLLNVAVLLFYTLIESLYVVLESGLGLEGEWLTSAWLNYGLPLLAAAAVILRASREGPPNPPRKGEGLVSSRRRERRLR
ncbi:MAG: hypothetical protein DLM67_03690 [Candidatus Nephthysia bennettiae]|uniref:Uncharacterized protein n=1 Tax=Candidatus Nephthysia bennettiae TaxID=3127016 RepID=A0A934K933_9BACT|nr:hypothetical protein [Candidatus Dormibacteraeota bacterium]MBJ7610711.1 hypothetical protein [Candidatus Dormibacteraeota bacterium]PZR99495.1 MAG: hypothetical protein DLM67_03690 [Candidatus Dormibacteraeota bacterium]